MPRAHAIAPLTLLHMFTVAVVACVLGPMKMIQSSQKFKPVPCEFKLSLVRFKFFKKMFSVMEIRHAKPVFVQCKWTLGKHPCDIVPMQACSSVLWPLHRHCPPNTLLTWHLARMCTQVDRVTWVPVPLGSSHECDSHTHTHILS